MKLRNLRCRFLLRVALVATGVAGFVQGAGALPAIWTEHSALKCSEATPAPGGSSNGASVTMRLNAARNEWETGHLLVRPDAPLTNFSLTLGTLTYGNSTIAPQNTEVRLAHYVSYKVKNPATGAMEPASIADPMVPFTGSVNLAANRTQSFYVQVYVPAGTVAGTYRAPLTMKWNGGAPQTHYVDVKVWPSTLPEIPPMKTSFGITLAYVAAQHGVTTSSTTAQTLLDDYYEMALDYGMTPRSLPYALANAKAAKYLDDPRVTGFNVSHTNGDVYLTTATAFLKQNSARWKKAYFYPVDEPVTQEHYDALKSYATTIRNIAPDARIISPFFKRPNFAPEKTFFDEVGNLVNMYCPNTKHYTEDAAVSAEMTRAVELGRGEPWWYVCGHPTSPYTNLHIAQRGIEHRLLPWQMKQHNVTGLLYWSMTCWGGNTSYIGTDDPWTDLQTIKGIDPEVYGDGTLFYPGRRVGIAGPIPSVRMMQLRDGLEDYALLVMLEKFYGQVTTNALIADLSASMTSTTSNLALLDLRRTDILRLLQVGQPAGIDMHEWSN